MFWINEDLTATSRKVVGKKCARDNPERYGILSIHWSWHCSCRTYFCCFALALANIRPWPLSCYSFKKVNSKPPTSITFGIVVCTFSDNLSRNSCILSVSWRKQFCVNCHDEQPREGALWVQCIITIFIIHCTRVPAVVSLARLLSYMLADYWLLWRLGAQCVISNYIATCVSVRLCLCRFFKEMWYPK